MRVKLHVLMRKLHRWGSLIILLPFLIVILSGIFLLLKKEVGWIQPPTQKGESKIPTITFDQMLNVARTVPEAEVSAWSDIDRIDLRPEQGSIKIFCKNRWEIQIDSHTAELLQVAYRRSDLIETIHDGSFFHDNVKLYVFLPSAVIVLGLWVTGIYLFYLPYKARLARRRKASSIAVRLPAKAAAIESDASAAD
jgi:uncharacterized iron-regulated membrane protein